MTDSLKVAQHITGLSLHVFDHEQVKVTNDATGDVLVNMVARPDGYNMIFHDIGLHEDEAVSLVVLLLIRDYNTLVYQFATED